MTQRGSQIDNYLKRHSAVKKYIFKRNYCDVFNRNDHDIPNTRDDDDNDDYE